MKYIGTLVFGNWFLPDEEEQEVSIDENVNDEKPWMVYNPNKPKTFWSNYKYSDTSFYKEMSKYWNRRIELEIIQYGKITKQFIIDFIEPILIRRDKKNKGMCKPSIAFKKYYGINCKKEIFSDIAKYYNLSPTRIAQIVHKIERIIRATLHFSIDEKYVNLFYDYNGKIIIDDIIVDDTCGDDKN